MLHPQGGSVRLFGLDPVEEPIETKRRVGYVSEDQALPPYLRIADVLAMHAELFESWDGAMATEILERFELDRRRKIGKLSKGQARRVAVLCAIAHRPELLLLDEPAGGFDPAARREFLETALRYLADEGSAILFSSHHMADVERIASRVAVLDRGHKVIDEELDDLRETTTLLTLPAEGTVGVADLRSLDGCLAAREHGTEVRGLFRGTEDEVAGRFAAIRNGSDPRFGRLTLEDLFIELINGRE
ncbi:MAG: ABC transporter ATP-binding protein, partial [Planctomycetota bacterium]